MGTASSTVKAEASFQAVVPPGKHAGQTISTVVNGQTVYVKIPAGVSPGQIFRFKMSECVKDEGPPQGPPPSAINPPSTQSPNVVSPVAQKFQVTIPPNVFPDQTFQVNVGGQIMSVKCPLSAGPGQVITIEAPSPSSAPNVVSPSLPPIQHQPPQVQAPINPAYTPTPGFQPATPQQIQVTIPPGVYPRMQFQVTTANGGIIMATAPSGSHPGQVITVDLPPPPQLQYGYPQSVPNQTVAPTITPYGYNSNTTSTPSQATYGLASPQAQPAVTSTQTEAYKITVPLDVRPGQTFEANIRGQKVMIPCPMNAYPGYILTIQVPSAPPSMPTQQVQNNGYHTVSPQPQYSSPQYQAPIQQQQYVSAPPPQQQYQPAISQYNAQPGGGYSAIPGGGGNGGFVNNTYSSGSAPPQQAHAVVMNKDY